MIHLLRKKIIGLPVLLLAGLALTGCNDLNGLTSVSVDEDNDDIEAPAGDPPATDTLSCAYPVGVDFGVDQGQFMHWDHVWQGFPEGIDQGQIQISDYYDCDGSRGVDLIVIDTAQFG